jgi:hypothetical protein
MPVSFYGPFGCLFSGFLHRIWIKEFSDLDVFGPLFPGGSFLELFASRSLLSHCTRSYLESRLDNSDGHVGTGVKIFGVPFLSCRAHCLSHLDRIVASLLEERHALDWSPRGLELPYSTFLDCHEPGWNPTSLGADGPWRGPDFCFNGAPG